MKLFKYTGTQKTTKIAKTAQQVFGGIYVII